LLTKNSEKIYIQNLILQIMESNNSLIISELLALLILL